MPRRISPTQELGLAVKYQDGATLRELAADLGVTPATVKGALKRQGVALRKRGGQYRHLSESDIRRVIDLRREGKTHAEIARSLGTHVMKVYRILDAAGMTKRISARRTRSTEGYWLVRLDLDDPLIEMGNGSGYVLEHRLVMARMMGRPLRRDETVHHLDGDRGNNDPSNLQLRQGKHGRGVAMRCHDCGSHNIHPVPL